MEQRSRFYMRRVMRANRMEKRSNLALAHMTQSWLIQQALGPLRFSVSSLLGTRESDIRKSDYD